jgi:uncharacterized pyridoxamine 5'-phosphate oxidase family protein
MIMSTDKRWTYKQITAKAEAEIASFLKNADKNPDLAHLYRERANGVYELWFSLTCGWIDDGDVERMRGLVPAQRERSEAASRS